MKLHHVTLVMTLYVYHTQAQYPMPFPGAMPMPMGMPSMPVQMPIVGPPQLPTVVMPYHSRTADKFREKPKKSKKKKSKKKPKRYESNSGSSSYSESHSGSSSSESGEPKFRAKNHNSRSQVLTPVVSYVTKDGYIVYQKKIQKDRAKDWLELGKNNDPNAVDMKDSASHEREMDREFNRQKFGSKSRRKHRREN